MQMKKIMAITLASAMIGATAVHATNLGNYPQPFVSSAGSPDFLVVVGANAAPSDVVGAIDLAARLGGETGSDVSVSGTTSTGVSGEGKALFTENTKIYLDDNLKKTGLRTALSSSDLPTLLASGTVTGDTTNYDYDQFIDFQNVFNLTFNKISGDLPTPDYYFGEFGTSASLSKYIVRTRVVFNDDLDTDQVIGEKINLFGTSYTIASTTNVTGTGKVVLFGSSDTRLMEEGEEVTVTLEGNEYTVKLLNVADADTIGVQVGSDSKSINKGDTSTVGGIDIYVDDVFYNSKAGTISQAKIGLGAKTLTLTDGQQAKMKTGGTNERTIDGSLVNLSVNAGKLTGIDLYFVGPDSSHDFISVGKPFVDPVWGTFSLNFDSLTTPLDSEARDLIYIKPSGTKDIEVSFTNDRGDAGTINWAHIASSGDATPYLGDSNGDPIIVVENQTIQKDQYFLVDSGDFSRMFELTSVSSLSTADSKLEIRDVMSGDTTEVALGSDNKASKIIDGQTYYFDASGQTSSDVPNLLVTWGTGASFQIPGSYKTYFPTLETRNGAKMAFGNQTANSNIPSATTIELPTGALSVSWDADTLLTLAAATTEKGESTSLTGTATAAIGTATTVRVGRTTNGGAWYTIGNIGNNTINVTMSEDAANDGNRTMLLFIEEQDDASDLQTITVQATTELVSSSQETSPLIGNFSYISKGSTGGTRGASPDSDSDTTSYVDLWGTYVQQYTRDQNWVKIYYPDNQVSANVFLLGPDASTTSSGTEGTTVHSSVPIKTPIAKLDGEVAMADKTTKNLILVGGPVVNDLVASLATSGKTKDAAWYRSEGAGTALIDLVSDAFTTGKMALVVAGYEAADTRTVTGYLQMFDSHSADFTGKNTVVYKSGVLQTSTA